MFENRIYDQTDGVAMGSSLGPILANIFMSHFETESLSKYSGNLHDHIYKWCLYVLEEHNCLILTY